MSNPGPAVPRTVADNPSDPHDREVMLKEVLEGLRRHQKELSSKYLYDAVGSALFEDITRLSEYYPTRTERALLERWMPEWVELERPAALVELGAGSAEKSRVVLDEMERLDAGNLYVPVDVSGDFLHETAGRLREEYDSLIVRPAVADITEPLTLPGKLPEPAWFALLGSTIGNFDTPQATRLLCRIVGQMRAGDRFLMGVDLRPGPNKSQERLEAAYDDAAGVTAEFNLNVLTVLNRELGSDFDPQGFQHEAPYVPEASRVEMHLRATSPKNVHFYGADEDIVFVTGETIRTEISCKYNRTAIDGIFSDAGLTVERWVQDDDGLFALILARRA